MKNLSVIKFGLLALLMVSSGAAMAGVSSINEDGQSASGKTMYKVTCSSGKEWRIYYSDGQWYDGIGAQGGNSRDLNQQAEFLCN